MSLEATAWAWRQDCSPMEKLILVLLADHMNGKSGRLNPGINRLCELSGMSRQGVFNQIKKLNERGLLLVEHCKGGANNYTLPVNAVDLSPVNAVDPSTPLTSPRSGRGEVNAVDGGESTPLTTPVHAVDPNRKEPEYEPEYEPEDAPAASGPSAALDVAPSPPKNVPQKFNPLAIDIPDALDTDAFRAAWADFVQHRREIRKPLTAIAVKKSLSQLESWGIVDAIAALNHSCRNGWQGLFRPDRKDFQTTPQIPRGQVVAKQPICHT